MPSDGSGYGPPRAGRSVDFYRAAGWDSEAIGRYKARFGSVSEMIYPLPAAYRRIQDGDVLALGAHEWRAVGREDCSEWVSKDSGTGDSAGRRL